MSTKKNKITKLPKGLPPPPPVPAGFDAWEYMGKGWCGSAEFYAWTNPDFKNAWAISSGRTMSSSRGGGNHYIRAIKHPAPKPTIWDQLPVKKYPLPPKPAAKVKKTKAIKAKLAWGTRWENGYPHVSATKHCDLPSTRIAILDVSDEAALIEQVKRAMFAERNRNEGEDYPFDSLHEHQKSRWSGYAYAALLNLGIIAPKKGRK